MFKFLLRVRLLQSKQTSYLAQVSLRLPKGTLHEKLDLFMFASVVNIMQIQNCTNSKYGKCHICLPHEQIWYTIFAMGANLNLLHICCISKHE